MGSVSSEEAFDPHSERFGSYSLSADVSESESCCSLSCRQYDPDATSSSPPSTPFTAGGFGITPHASGAFPAVGGTDMVVLAEKADLSEVEMMKERFAKLLLGEDMSGGGKGVCTALAISNAITNLSATVFGELWRLEPLAPVKKSMWHREMESILCVSGFIVELVPSLQDFPGGGVFEVMVTRARSDLYTNLPALKKLNSMLIGMLDEFVDIEFWYVDRGILVADAEKINGYPSSSSVGIGSGDSLRQEEKWWLPCPRVPPNGLSDEARKRLLQCKDYANQILKAAMAINSSVLSEMEIPDIYYRTLPKTGKSCLGDVIYSYIIADKCSPESVLDCLDLSSEHDALELANRVEAAIHVWSQKHRKKHQHSRMQKPSWGSKVKGLIGDLGKSPLLAHRSESLLHCLRLRCPGLPQTDLDMNKIQHNKDVGQSIIESYSRVTESLAFNIIARIDDVIYVDDAARQYAAAELVSPMGPGLFGGPIQRKISPSPFSINSPLASPFFVPKLCSPPPIIRSPRKTRNALSKGIRLGLRDGNVNMLISADREKGWSYTGNVSARRDSGVAPERD